MLDQYIDALQATNNLSAETSKALEYSLALLSGAKTDIASGDVEMTEIDPLDAEIITAESGKRRRSARVHRVVTSSPVLGEDVAPVGLSETGTKRALEVSPSKIDGPSKRSRVSTRAIVETKEQEQPEELENQSDQSDQLGPEDSEEPEVESAKGLDLEHLVMTEGDIVDLELVPLAKKVVRLLWDLLCSSRGADLTPRFAGGVRSYRSRRI